MAKEGLVGTVSEIAEAEVFPCLLTVVALDSFVRRMCYDEILRAVQGLDQGFLWDLTGLTCSCTVPKNNAGGESSYSLSNSSLVPLMPKVGLMRLFNFKRFRLCPSRSCASWMLSCFFLALLTKWRNPDRRCTETV